MESPQNPYAAPSAPLEDLSIDRVWRDGKVLVAPRTADLPPRCVKCGQPAETMKKRTFFWHHPALYLLLLCYMILYLIVALIVRKRATLTVGLCSKHAAKRRNGILLGWGGALAGIVLAILGGGQDSCGVMIAGAVLFLGTIIAGMFMARIMYAQHMDSVYARMKGCGEGFLSTLPEFHG